MEHATEIERQIATKLVRDILAAGHTLSVYDGGEFTVKLSTNAATILGALCTSGEDILIVRDVNRARLGWIKLVWDGDWTLICDHTDSDVMNALIAGASELADAASEA